mgnify:CR=1 FL=1
MHIYSDNVCLCSWPGIELSWCTCRCDVSLTILTIPNQLINTKNYKRMYIYIRITINPSLLLAKKKIIPIVRRRNSILMSKFNILPVIFIQEVANGNILVIEVFPVVICQTFDNGICRI